MTSPPRRPPPWLVALGALPAALAIGIFVFVARFSIAHDEARCPFREVETRWIADGVGVREEVRRCLEEVEEHRWIAIRGARRLELGRYPLEREHVGRGLPWQAREQNGRTIVTVRNDRGEIVFREPGPDAARL